MWLHKAGLVCKRRESVENGINYSLLTFSGQGQALGWVGGELLKASTQDVSAQLGWQRPSDFFKVSGNAPRHKKLKGKYSLCKARSCRGLNTSGLHSLPCVIGNNSDSITIRGMWLSCQERTFIHIFKWEGCLFSFVFLRCWSPKVVFCGGSGRGSNAEEGRSLPVQEDSAR